MKNYSIFSRLMEDAASDVANYKNLRRRTIKQNRYIASKLEDESANAFEQSINLGGDTLTVSFNFKAAGEKFDVSIHLNGQEPRRIATNVGSSSIKQAARQIVERATYDIVLRALGNDNENTAKDLPYMDLFRAYSMISNANEYLSSLNEDAFSNLDRLVEDALTKALKGSTRRTNVVKAFQNRDYRLTGMKSKAKQSLYDEAPDFNDGEYAYWDSKNGPRRVTVVSIDEPNQRAKINTDKGATMYVPLSKLSKDTDGLYDDLDNLDN